MNAIRIAPTSGTNVIAERRGRPVTSIVVPPTRRDHEVAAGHHDQAHGDAKGVVLYAARLNPAEAAGPWSAVRAPMPLTVPSMIARSNTTGTRPRVRRSG